MNRQKERLRDDVGQILKDKEVILAKFDRLVVVTEKSVYTSLDITDARKFRKQHSYAKSVIESTVKIIDRLYAAFEDDDEDEGEGEDQDDADETKLSVDESKSDDAVKIDETTSDLIKLSSDDSTTPPLVADPPKSSFPAAPIVQLEDSSYRLPKPFTANHDNRAHLSATPPDLSLLARCDVGGIKTKDILITPPSDKKDVLFTPPSSFSSTSLQPVGEQMRLSPIDRPGSDSDSSPDSSHDPAVSFKPLSATTSLYNANASGVDSSAFSPVPPGSNFRPISREDSPLCEASVSPTISRSNQPNVNEPLIASTLPQTTNTDLNQPFLTKYGPKKTLKTHFLPFLPLPQTAATPQSSIRTPVLSLDAASSAYSSPLPLPSVAQAQSSQNSLRHCIKSSFRLNVYDTLNRQFLREEIKTERKYVPLDRCGVSNIESCDAFPALLWVTISGNPDVMDLGQIIDDITDFYNESPPAPHLPVEEKMICAIMDDDGSWYRGKVNRVSVETEEAEVALLDIGKFLIRPFNNILPLISRFVDMPCRTLPCRLRGVGPAPDRHGNRARDWRSFNDKLEKAFDTLKRLTKNFKLTAAFKFIQGIEEMFVDVHLPRAPGHQQGSVKDLLIQKGVGIALSDDQLKAAIKIAKGLPCAIHGDEGSEPPNDTFFATILRKEFKSGRGSSSAPEPSKTPTTNMMRPRIIRSSPPDSAIEVKRHRFVKSLQCSADEMFYRPAKSYPASASSASSSSSAQYLRFLFTWIESPDKFYICLESAYSDLNNLTQGMKNFYNNVAPEDFRAEFDPRVGDFVVAFCHQYDNFYRATVLDVREGANRGLGCRSYYVYFVDFGNCEWKKMADMGPLHQDFAFLPPQCIRCRPWPRLLPPMMIWSTGDTERMKQLIAFENFYAGRIEVESTTQIPLKPQSEDALDIHVILENPVLDPAFRKEVGLNSELIRLGIARDGLPRQNNPIEELRDSQPISPDGISNHTFLSCSPRPLAPVPPSSTQSSAQPSTLHSTESSQPCSPSVDENKTIEENETIDEAYPSLTSGKTTASKELAHIAPEADGTHDDARNTTCSVIDAEGQIFTTSTTPTAEVTIIPSTVTVMKCVLNDNVASTAGPTDISTKIGQNLLPVLDFAAEICEDSSSEQPKSMPISQDQTDSTVSPSTPRKLSTSSGSQSSPSSSVTNSGSLLSPSSSGTTSDSLALDSQPPNVVGGAGAAAGKTTGSATGSRSSSVTTDKPSVVAHRKPAATKDDFLILKEGQWYLCEVTSFVHPENFFLRFPFGDGLLSNFQTEKGDDDKIFAIYPTVATEDGEARSSAQIRCLQKEIDHYCASKGVAGEYLTSNGGSTAFKDDEYGLVEEEWEEEDPIRIGVRLLTRQENGSFFRSLVREVKADSVVVYVMDYGSVVSVDRKTENFIELPEQFGSLPRMALRGRLANVRPKGGSWSLEAINWFIDQVTSKHLIVNIKSTKYDRLIVDLWDTSGDDNNTGNDTSTDTVDFRATGDVLINASIVAHGYAEPWTR